MNLFDRIIEAVVPSNPDIAVQLAGKYADVPQHVEGKSFTLTQKLDGTRGVLVKRGDDVSLWSRHGKPINGFESVMEDLAKAPGSYVIDGELLPRGWQKMTNDEQFKKALSGKSGKVADKTTMVLAAFDLIDIKEWDAKHSTTPYIERRKRLDQIKDQFQLIDVVPVLYQGTDTSVIKPLHDKMKQAGAEGLMLNINNSPYHFDRTRDLLKVKEMSDMALKCVGFTPGNGKYTNTLGAITFAVPDPNFPDATVNVSGMDDAMRDEVWNNKQKYLGRYQDVQYFGKSQNAKGKISLRHPVFLKWRETDYVPPKTSDDMFAGKGGTKGMADLKAPDPQPVSKQPDPIPAPQPKTSQPDRRNRTIWGNKNGRPLLKVDQLIMNDPDADKNPDFAKRKKRLLDLGAKIIYQGPNPNKATQSSKSASQPSLFASVASQQAPKPNPPANTKSTSPQKGDTEKDALVVIVNDKGKLRVRKVGDDNHFVQFPHSLRTKPGDKYRVADLSFNGSNYKQSGKIVKENTLMNKIRIFEQVLSAEARAEKRRQEKLRLEGIKAEQLDELTNTFGFSVPGATKILNAVSSAYYGGIEHGRDRNLENGEYPLDYSSYHDTGFIDYQDEEGAYEDALERAMEDDDRFEWMWDRIDDIELDPEDQEIYDEYAGTEELNQVMEDYADSMFTGL